MPACAGSSHLREAPHTEQSLHGARALIAVDCAQLSPAQRQVPVAVPPMVVDLDVEGAVHGLQLVVVALDLQQQQQVCL